MTNLQIYTVVQSLSNLGEELKSIRMPIRIGFYLQKNIKVIQQAAEEIEAARLSIGEQFGEHNGSGYVIPDEKIEEANRELQELFSLEQDLPIHIFKLDDFDGIELTYQQLSAIMFMIEE